MCELMHFILGSVISALLATGQYGVDIKGCTFKASCGYRLSSRSIIFPYNSQWKKTLHT